MSSDQSPIIIEFLDRLDEIDQFTLQDRQLGQAQQLIILKQKLEYLKISVNALLNAFSGDLDLRIDILSDAIGKLRRIMNRIPTRGDLRQIWFKLSFYQTILLNAMANIQGLSKISQITSQANLLSHLLLDVQRVQGFPTADDVDLDDRLELIRFGERRRGAFNSIQITAGLFTSATTAIYQVDRSIMIHWMNEAFWHLHLVLSYHQTINYDLVWRLDSQDISEYYRKIWSSFQPLSYITNYMIVCYQIWGDNWPEEINTQGLLSATTIDGILSGVYNILKYFTFRLHQVEDMHKEGRIDKNARPEEFKGYQLSKQLGVTIRSQANWIEAMRGKHQETQEELEAIDDALEDYELVLSGLIDNAGDLETMLTMSLGQNYASNIPRYLGLAVRKEILQRGKGGYDRSLQKVNEFFQQANLSEYPAVFYTKMITELYLQSSTGRLVNQKLLRKDLEQAVQVTSHLPRLYLSFLELELLLDIKSNTISEDLVQVRMDTMHGYIVENSCEHLLEAFSQLERYLFEHKVPDIQVNVLDIHSWIRPEFSNSTIESLPSVIKFVPFFLHRYRITDRG